MKKLILPLLMMFIMIGGITAQTYIEDDLNVDTKNNPNSPKADVNSRGIGELYQPKQIEEKSWWDKFMQLFAMVPSSSCIVSSEYRASYLSGCNGGTFNVLMGTCSGLQISSYGGSCSAGQRINLYACPCRNDQSCICSQIFTDQWLKTTSTDNLDLLIACGGGNCYLQSWFRNAINNQYIGYDCLSCGDVTCSGNPCRYASDVTCGQPITLNSGCTGTCSGTGTKCAIGYTCNAGVCTQNCVPGTKECTSTSTYKQCKTDGTGYTTLQCTSGQICNNGNCVSSCTTGTKRCVSSSIYETCNGGIWSASSCPSTQICSSGNCVNSISCQPNIKECSSSNSYRQCNSAGNGWSNSISCATGELCSGSGTCIQNSVCYPSCNNSQVCINSVCTNTASCTSVSQCDDGNSCTTDSCTNNNCINQEIIGCGSSTCKAYEKQGYAIDECNFSFTKLFTKSGFKEYWNDKQSVVIGVAILLILLLFIIFKATVASSTKDNMFR